MATVGVVATMIVTICFLLPKNNWDVGFLLGFNNPLQSAEFFMHLVIPVLGLLSFVIFDKRNSKKHLFILPLLGALPVFGYGVFYVLNIFLKVINPADWYGFLDGELWIGILIIALILLGTYLIGLLILSLNRIGNNDEEQEETSSYEEKYVPAEHLSSEQKEEQELIQEEKAAEEEKEELAHEENISEIKKEEVLTQEETIDDEEEDEYIEEPAQEEESQKEIEEEEAPTQEEKKEEKPKTKKSSTKSKEKKPAEKKKEPSKEGSTKVYHLTKRKEDDMWAITFVGGKKPVKLFKTKKEAEEYLAILTKNQGATALIRNSKGAKAGKFASSIKSEEK